MVGTTSTVARTGVTLTPTAGNQAFYRQSIQQEQQSAMNFCTTRLNKTACGAVSVLIESLNLHPVAAVLCQLTA